MLYYKVNVLAELKKHGYNQTVLLRRNLINQSAVQSFRDNKVVGIKVLDKLCALLQCQPGDIIGWKPDIDKITADIIEEIEKPL